MKTNLFVIKQRGRDLYWNCSTEHGCGWNPHHPKQSFSPSELSNQVLMMIKRDYFQDCELLELRLESSAHKDTTE